MEEPVQYGDPVADTPVVYPDRFFLTPIRVPDRLTRSSIMHAIQKHFSKKWSLSLKIMPLVFGTVLLKLVFHYYGWEFIELSALFTSLVTGTVFLMGFLLSGVLADYKESEKIPTELTASLETMADEAEIIFMARKAPEAREFAGFSAKMVDWFHRKTKTRDLMEELRGFNRHIRAFEGLTQANFVSRIKQEQHNLRKLLLRVHTIRETSFIQSGYAIAEIVSWLLFTALMFIKLDPFIESLFFITPITYLFIYMLALIRDLDNPFDYTDDGESAEQVSLHELHVCVARLGDRARSLAD
jgi:hypothetical protein